MCVRLCTAKLKMAYEQFVNEQITSLRCRKQINEKNERKKIIIPFKLRTSFGLL